MNTRQISEQATRNDAFRMSGSGVMLTSGVQNLPDVWGLLRAVRGFKTFTDDNDPYGEHDFGAIEWSGDTVYWKIDYFDQSLTRYCDPLSSKCLRILTVLLAREY